ncbi:MAG: hypothetical protein JWR03_584 [Cohnella sp.]|nr:hypothetical protein [Cohnella sp.]
MASKRFGCCSSDGSRFRLRIRVKINVITPITVRNDRLIHKPGRLVAWETVPIMAVTIKLKPSHRLICPHLLSSNIFPEEIRINNQLESSINPAAVVKYSYTLFGIAKEKAIDKSIPAVVNPIAGKGLFRNVFRNNGGASLSLAIVTIMFVTANNEAIMVENPARMKTPLNTCGTNGR